MCKIEDHTGMAYLFLHGDVCLKYYNISSKFIQVI